MATFEELLLKGSFSVPSFQRAYSWGEEQLKQFISDLEEASSLENAPYYYGHYLLLVDGKEGGSIKIVDGQQRMTTAMLFLLAAQHSGITFDDDIRIDKLLKTDDGDERLATVAYDKEYLKLIFKKNNSSKFKDIHKTKSQKRLKKGYNFFLAEMEKGQEKIPLLIKKLLGADISINEIKDKIRATLIFAFQNDRGKDLTALEKVKAFVAYQYYLLSASHSRLETFDTCFANLYEASEKIEGIKENDLLKWIFQAHYKGFTTDSTDFEQHYRDASVKLGDKERLEWLEQLVFNLKKGYEAIAELTKYQKHESLDASYINYVGISVYSEKSLFYTAFIKYSAKVGFDGGRISDNYKKLFNLFEQLLFRATFSSNNKNILGTDWARTEFNIPLNANSVEAWAEKINTELAKKMRHFGTGINDVKAVVSQQIYGNLTTAQVCYVLWRYELYMSKETGVINKLFWSQLKGEHGRSVEHIFPQNFWEEASYEESLSKGYDLWCLPLEGDNGKLWYKEKYRIRMNGWGNLLPVTMEINSSLGKKPFSKKVQAYKKTNVIIFNEIKGDAINNRWTGVEIDQRQEAIINFINNQWLS